MRFGACAAVVAAVENGYCNKGEDITVKLKGGDLIVNYTDERILLQATQALFTRVKSSSKRYTAERKEKEMLNQHLFLFFVNNRF